MRYRLAVRRPLLFDINEIRVPLWRGLYDDLPSP
jgi:hypothetical protein